MESNAGDTAIPCIILMLGAKLLLCSVESDLGKTVLRHIGAPLTNMDWL